jgi:hypothetical protein
MTLCNVPHTTRIAIVLAAVCAAGCHRAPQVPALSQAGELTAASETPGASEYPGVVVDQESQRRLGLVLAPVVSSKSAAATRGTAVVLDSATLTAVLADISAAREEAVAARDNYQRLQRLYTDDGNASHQAVEAASTQWATARARVATAEARARSDWGAQVVDPQGLPSGLLRDLESGRVVLLRAEFEGVFPSAAEQLVYTALGTSPDDPVAQTLGFVARSRSPTLAAGGPSVLLRAKAVADGNSDFRPGTRLSVIATSNSGPLRPLVPAAAAFADGGQFWSYVAREANRFDRIPLASMERVADGYPASAGIKDGDRVVVQGAPLLLSLERGAGSVAGGE